MCSAYGLNNSGSVYFDLHRLPDEIARMAYC